jgi:hypothetical protein
MKTTEANPAPAPRPEGGRTRRGAVLSLILVAWLGATAAGLRWMLASQSAPRPAARAAVSWPADSALTPAPGRPVLLLFAHPHCPCTPAGLEELAWLLRTSPDRPEVAVLFVRPPGAPAGWERTAAWARAAALPGARVLADHDGREAWRFGATTSGEALVYEGGRLVFQGGLTGGRGHHGDHAGARAVPGRLRDGGATVQRPVFGCPLLGGPEGREGGGEGWR